MHNNQIILKNSILFNTGKKKYYVITMKNICKPKIIYFVLTLFALSVFSSCAKNTKKENMVSAQEIKIIEDTQNQWHLSNKIICIVFGYGYNDKDFTSEVIQNLSEKYGLYNEESTENGLIYPLIFPEDFKVGSNTRVSSLLQYLDDKQVAGIITLGAPEYMNTVIANIEEQWDNLIPFPVYSFFPQDDILGIEAVSNFVLDKAINQSKTNDDVDIGSEEVAQVQLKEMPEIINRSIQYMLLTGCPLPTDKNLISHVHKIAGRSLAIENYIDPETGIQSANHFVLKKHD